MSYRTSDQNGAAANYVGTEFSPAELDPFGNNAGLETPYIELVSNPPPPEFDNTPFLLDGYYEERLVNGQRQTCSLDGMGIPCAQLASMSADSLAVGLYDRLGRQVDQIPVERINGRLRVPEASATYVRNGETDRFLRGSLSYNFIDVSGQVAQEQQQSNTAAPSSLAPKGYASDKKLSDADCDKYLAKIFGGEGAVVGGVSDPGTLALHPKQNLPPRMLRDRALNGTPRPLGHGPEPYPQGSGTDKGGIIHIYGDPRGVTNGPLYTPYSPKMNISEADYDSLGNRVVRVSYKTGLAITFVHTATGEQEGVDTNNMNSIRIGNIGGPGGSGPPNMKMARRYVHTHIIFYSNFGKGIRVDPRKVFCGQ